MVDVDILERDAQNEKHAECPCKDGREVLADYVLPEVILDEVV